MNTMRYIDIIFDSLPIEQLEKLNALRMDINFVRESLYGDKIALHGEQKEDGNRVFEFKNAAGEALCRISFELK